MEIFLLVSLSTVLLTTSVVLSVVAIGFPQLLSSRSVTPLATPAITLPNQLKQEVQSEPPTVALPQVPEPAAVATPPVVFTMAGAGHPVLGEDQDFYWLPPPSAAPPPPDLGLTAISRLFEWPDDDETDEAEKKT